MELRAYWRIVVRRWWLPAGLAILVGLLTLAMQRGGNERNIEPGFGYVDADEGEHIFHNRTSSLLYTPPLWLSLADDAGLSIPGNCSSS